VTDRLQRLNLAFLLLFGAVALALVVWGVLRGPELLARKDNPRLVEAELRVQRGRILDRDGVVLAQTVGELGELERVYDQSAASSPAVGYYSLRHGVSGVEASFDDVLRGRPTSGWAEWWDALLHRNPAGQDVHLTLDAELGEVADDALGEHLGAVVLLEARSGEILALVSHPGYDPNLLDEGFDSLNTDQNAPLLSRPTQALYQPGTALQPLLLAVALERRVVRLGAPVDDVGRPVQAGEAWLNCMTSPLNVTPTITVAMAHACPAPFVDLASVLGPAGLVEGLADFGLYQSPDLPLELAGGSRPGLDGGEEGLAAEATGQGELTLSPLQMAWAVAAIANEGELPTLQLVRRIGGSEGEAGALVVPKPAVGVDGLTAETAATVAGVMLAAVESGAARGAAVEGWDVAGHVGTAVAGPSGAQNQWFLGYAPAAIPQPFARYVVVVLLEDASDPGAAAAIGGRILEHLRSEQRED
jgi:peptidoglycan glycosyltransferase